MAKKKTINILKKIKGKPSIALGYMVRGLLKHSKRKDFGIQMNTWGTRGFVHKNGKDIPVCYGCAATCTIQQIANKKLNHTNIQYNREILGFKRNELSAFEHSINQARMGEMEPLFKFCKVKKIKFQSDSNYVHMTSYLIDWQLSTDDWKKQLPKVRKYIKYLQKHKL